MSIQLITTQLENGDRIIFDPKNPVGLPWTPELEPLVKENPFDKVANNPTDRVSSPGSLRRSVDRRAATDLRKAREEWDTKRRLEERRAATDSRKAREDSLLKNTASAAKPLGGAKSIDALTEDQMLICAPDAPCFDLTRKEWVVVDVSDIGDITWNDDLYDDLVWPAEEKQVLLAIAESYRRGGENPSNGVLDSKSRGTTIMLQGPIGAGKSFAVEAVAEKLHMPLYCIGVADLIRDFDEFETHLEDTLERCSKWNAILLIENLDFLFSKSLDGTVKGNVCAQLVDQLARHPGLVLLTSSDSYWLPGLLKEAFDLELCLGFPNLEEKRKIWSNALSAAVPLKDRSFTSEHLDALAQYSIKGREIQSTVNMATKLAQFSGSSLKMEHVERVLELKRPKAPPFPEFSIPPLPREQRWREHIPHGNNPWGGFPHADPYRRHRSPEEHIIIEQFLSSRSPSPEGGRPARKKFPTRKWSQPDLPSRTSSPDSWHVPRRNPDPRGKNKAWDYPSRSPSFEGQRSPPTKEKYPRGWGDAPDVTSRSSTPEPPVFDNSRVEF